MSERRPTVDYDRPGCRIVLMPQPNLGISMGAFLICDGSTIARVGAFGSLEEVDHDWCRTQADAALSARGDLRAEADR